MKKKMQEGKNLYLVSSMLVQTILKTAMFCHQNIEKRNKPNIITIYQGTGLAKKKKQFNN